MKKMNKELKKLLIILGLYSLADGIIYIFQELWMAENNLSVGTISTVFSLCAILSVSVIFLSSNLIKKEKLKKFASSLFLIKAIVMFMLFILNHSGLNILIKFLIMLDYVIDVELWASLYPLITLIKKDDKIYAIRDFIYDACYYVGVFLTGILLGKSIGLLQIDYNFYILIACIITFISFGILHKTDLDKYVKKEKNKTTINALQSIVNKMKTDKISRMYLLYVLFGSISYSCITDLKVLILVEYLHFSASAISNYSIILGIGAVAVGALVMEKLTCKNNYINILLKYGTRLFLYILTFIFSNKLFILIAFIFIFLSSDAYTHITDAPYVNRYNNDEQLAFNNLKEMVDYIATSIGIFLCGIALNYGVRYIFLIGSIFIAIQIVFAFYALNLRNQESSDKNVE